MKNQVVESTMRRAEGNIFGIYEESGGKIFGIYLLVFIYPISVNGFPTSHFTGRISVSDFLGDEF